MPPDQDPLEGLKQDVAVIDSRVGQVEVNTRELFTLVRETREDTSYIRGKLDQALKVTQPASTWWEANKNKAAGSGLAGGIITLAAILKTLGF